MFDLRRILILALLLATPKLAPAQDLSEWRRQVTEQAARSKAAEARYKAQFDQPVNYDVAIRVGELVVAYQSGDLDPRDTTAIARGLAQATATLRERFGEAGVALTNKGHWSAQQYWRYDRRIMDRVRLQRANDQLNSVVVRSPVDPDEIERIVITYAGERLVETIPALRGYGGWSAFLPNDEIFAEIIRRMATSWSGVARRCADGATGSCAVVLSPFDVSEGATRYFDPGDFRAVIASARLPALGDSVYFDQRRRCLDGTDSVCANLVEKVNLPDPFNPMVRGTLLTHAIELGGAGAIARANERPDAPSLELLAHMADVPVDSLLDSWHTRSYIALENERGKGETPILFSSLAWSGVLLFFATRRRFL